MPDCYTKEIRLLGSAERREIADYISGRGIDYKFHGFVDDSYGVPKGPDIRTPGWERKIAEGLRHIFRHPEQLKTIPGIRSNQKKILESEATAILKHLLEEPPRYVKPKGVGLATWQALAQYIVTATGAAIDDPVTTDIHRLIRLPESLNGKTGFRVKQLNFANLDDFDPFRDTQVFKGSTQVFIQQSPPFRIGDIEYPSMSEVKEELPLSVAMFLLCKGVATITE